jgi:hypothetical protein
LIGDLLDLDTDGDGLADLGNGCVKALAELEDVDRDYDKVAPGFDATALVTSVTPRLLGTKG